MLYYNPLTEAEGPAPDSADRALHYACPANLRPVARRARAFADRHGRRQRVLGRHHRSHGAARLGPRRHGRPAGAVASRLLAGSADTDLLLRGVLISDYWLLTFPDEGTLFLRVDTNLWPFLKQTLLPVWFFGQSWNGPVDYRPTAGPGVQNTAVVLGATGRFAGLEGSAVEEYRVTEIDRFGKKAEAVGELHLHLFEAQLTAEGTPPGDG